MTILAIETSCDDTCIAIVKIQNLETKILSNVISSQVKLHAKYGGVWPSLAKREHQKNLPLVLQKALKGAKLLLREVDLIAVTVGPGLEPCLWVGVNFAKDLAKKLKVPIVPVNHVEAHIFANFIDRFQVSGFKFQELFPAVCLVVSGGHTQLILMKGLGKYKILGETRDDAAGECFDKVARILDLGYPGGPAIATEAAKFQVSSFKFQVKLPRPMIYQKNYDFSFSGLKTAVLYLVKELTSDNKQLTTNQKREICTEVQQAVIDVLIYKTLKAAKEYNVKTIVLGGGVAANNELRKQLKQKVQKEIPNTKYIIPDTKYCTDNAAMVAVAGYFHTRAKRRVKKNECSLTRHEKETAEKIEAMANLRL